LLQLGKTLTGLFVISTTEILACVNFCVFR